MLNEEEETHSKINQQLRYEEEKEYWQDKLLELKMKEKKDNYTLNQRRMQLKEELDNESQKNELLTKQHNGLQQQLTQMKQSQQGIADQLNAINADIKAEYDKHEDLSKQIGRMTEYLYKLNMTDNLIEHFLAFPPEFTKQVYAICTDKVNAVLQYKSQMNHNTQPNGNQGQFSGTENEMKPQLQPQPFQRFNMNYPAIYYPVYPPNQKNYPKPE